MSAYFYLSDIQSSMIRVLLVIGVAIILPLVFNKHNRWRRRRDTCAAVSVVAGERNNRADGSDMGLSGQLVVAGT